jgi:cytoskeleton protein RodZ
LPSFGDKLKQEREKRKISLEQISASTKIGTRMLQALEENKFNQLPGGIFNKGFVRAYSHCLGLDEEQVVAEYLQASGDAPPPKTEIAVREDEARENEEHVRRLESSEHGSIRQLPWGWFAALLLVVALALSLWSRHQREQVRQSLRPTPASSATDAPASSAPQVIDEASGKIANPNAEGANEASGPNAPTRDSASGAAIPREFTVTIQARDESWISVTADGKTAPSETLLAGSERTVSGRKQITVKAGNAGDLDFRFNGTKLDVGAKSGEVKTVNFGPSGLLPLTTASPATTP